MFPRASQSQVLIPHRTGADFRAAITLDATFGRHCLWQTPPTSEQELAPDQARSDPAAG